MKTNPFFPPDEAARRAVLAETRRNVSVHAGAGTGKTTLMVRRVVNLVKSGVPLNSLLVVTFTEAAAAELRLRIRKLLTEEAGNDERCGNALSQIPFAWISTIHGFASRVLREYFNLAGVDPDFAVTESHFTPLEMEISWDRWLLDRKPSREERELLARTGTALQKKVAMQVEGKRWLESRECFGGIREAEEIFARRLEKVIADVENMMEQCLDKRDKRYGVAAELLGRLREIERAMPLPPPDLLALAGSGINLRVGSAKNWSDPVSAREVLRNVRNFLEKESGIIYSGKWTESTWRFAGSFARELREKWDSDGSRLSYDDLLFRLNEVLAKEEKLAGELSERFSHVLIDEFQDTSREQAEIFLGFLGKGGRIPRGRVTIVGDDKQSIYGWRSADIETYNKFRRDLEKGGALSVDISTNFRSTRSIVRFVNSFGEKLFSSRSREEEPFSCEYSPIKPAPGAVEGKPVGVLVLPGGDAKEGRPGAAELAKLQGDWFAGFVGKGIEAGESPGDYALLYKSGTHLRRFVDALEKAGIPYTVSTSKDFLKRLEIIDLHRLLKCLADPGDDVSLVHTLRSPFFGLNDVEITGYIMRNEVKSGVRNAMETLEVLRSALRSMPLADFLFELLMQTPMLAVLCSSGFQVSRRLGNLQHILEQVMSREITTTAGLLEVLDENLSPGRPEEPPRVPAEGGAVTLSSIHSAKGLAWKHVVLAAMPGGSGEGRRRGPVIFYDHERIAAVDLGMTVNGRTRVRSPYWSRIECVGKARRVAEVRRLLYVAVTRAKETLTILAGPAGRKGGDGASILWKCLEAAEKDDPGCFSRTTLQVEEGTGPKLRSLIEPVGFPGSVSNAGTSGGEFFPVEPIPDGWRGRGAALGDMVHRVMEKLDMKNPEEWIRANRVDLERFCGDDFSEVTRLCLNFFGMNLPFDPRRCRVAGREYPYMARVPGGFKQRYIDLLLETPEEEMAVVDYKTDVLDKPGSEAVVRDYGKTMEFYVRDMAAAFGKPVRGYLVFLRHSRFLEVSPDSS